jgi:hypothetical protein
MINVKNKTCVHVGCSILPSYGRPGDKGATYCLSHKQDDMINVVNKICVRIGCLIRASYGKPGNQPTHCAQHKVTGDISCPRTTCIQSSCKSVALYGYTRPLHCEIHKAPEEFDLVQAECISCHLPDILDKNGHCPTCDPIAMRRVYLAKQKPVKDFIDANTDLKYVSYDRMIDKGVCGKERPDLLFDFSIQFVVNEIDEDQHSGRECSCEQGRMVNITGSLGMKTLFLRWNPDKYKPLHGKQASKTERLEALQRQLEYWRKTPLPEDGTTFVVYMYFDGDDPSEWRTPIKIM